MVVSYLQEYLVYTAIVVCTVWFLVRCARSTKDRKLPPGPPGWPIIGNLLVLFQDPEYPNGENYFTRRAKEYGDIYKLEFGPQFFYVLSNPDLIREMCNHNKIKSRPPGVGYKKAFGPEAHGIGFASGPEWETLIKFTKTLFRDLGVGRGIFEECINSEIKRLIRKINDIRDVPCWEVFELSYLAIGNINCGLTFGQQYDYDDSEFKAAIRHIKAFSETAGASAVVLSSRLLCAMPFGPGKRLIDCLHDFRSFLESRIRETKATLNEAPNSFVKAFLPHMERGEKYFDEANLFACSLELFFAGTENLTGTITWTALFLAMHPRVQRRCQQELNDLVDELPGNILPCYADRSKLPYLLATLHESERLSTVARLTLAHVVDEDLRLFGYDFPKGTLVVGSFRAIYMNEEKYPEPRKFIPERFLKDGHFEADKDINPFSTGRRACPGEALARMQIFLIIVNMLHEFTIEAPEGIKMPDITLGHGGITRLPEPFAVIFKSRQK